MLAWPAVLIVWAASRLTEMELIDALEERVGRLALAQSVALAYHDPDALVREAQEVQRAFNVPDESPADLRRAGLRLVRRIRRSKVKPDAG